MIAEAATVWNGGAADSNWFTDGNWNSGVPTSSTDAEINGGTVNIINGTAEAQNLTLSSVVLNISNATLAVGGLDFSGAETIHFFLGANGASTITATGTVSFADNSVDASAATPHIISAYGFMAFDADAVDNNSYTLYSANSVQGAFSSTSPFHFDRSSTDLKIRFKDSAMTHWDLDVDSHRVFETTDGWVKLGPAPAEEEGGETPPEYTDSVDLMATFLNTKLSPADIEALKAYIQAGNPGGMNITFADDFDDTGKAIIHLDSGYNVIGWGLTAFNSMYGTGVTLGSLELMDSTSGVPEPATWMLLLLGGMGLAVCFRKKTMK